MIIPSRSDLIWLDFDPQAGREQAGRRPALVLSEQAFNELTGFAVICPITSHSKNYAFEVPLPAGVAFSGVVLTDQFRSLDFRKQKIKVVGNVPIEPEFLKSVLRNVRSILA